MLTKKLAEEIVEQTMIRMNRNLNVMDTNGMILASGETERINSIHEGAEFVAKTGKPLLITEENLVNWYGTKPGMNMPVRFQDQIIGVIGVTGNPDEIQEIATLVQMTTEIMVHQALMTSRTEYIRKIKELIFEELKGREPTSIIARERLKMLGFTEVSPFITLLMESKQFQPSPSGMIEILEEQFNQDSVLIGLSDINEIFILIAGLNQTELKQKYLTIINNLQKCNDIRIGIGHSVDTLDDVHDSYQAAKNALQFGPSWQTIIFFEDVELITLLKKNTTIEAQDFSDRILYGLDDSLRKTLTNYFENNLNNTLTADSLEIHRHTLTYRLKRVKEITKLNPTIFNEAILLKTALLLSKT